MFIEILIALFLGLFFGIITGLVPGLHPNTVIVGLLAASPMILTLTTPLILAIFITVVATTNTFTDSIPSIYLGAPEESTALSVLPGHRLLIEGKGHEAITLTVIGGLLSLILGLILVPVLLPTIKAIFPHLKKIIVYLLIISVLFLLYREKKVSSFCFKCFFTLWAFRNGYFVIPKFKPTFISFIFWFVWNINISN